MAYIYYTIDLKSVDGYNVVQRISWHQIYNFGDEKTMINAEYLLSDFHFAQQPPNNTMFASRP